MKHDLTKPISKNREDYKEVLDCFGKGFDITTLQCSNCHDNEICSVFYKDNVIANKIKEVEAKVPEIIDKVDFDKLDKSKLEDYLLEASDRNSPVPAADLITYVKEKAGTVDDLAAIAWLKEFIITSGKIVTREGKIIRKG